MTNSVPGEGHTKGPWQATTNAYGCHFVQRWEAGEEHELICGGNSHDTLTEANARLIASAPDMLDALILAKGWLELWSSAERELAIINAAIAKAQGGQP